MEQVWLCNFYSLLESYYLTNTFLQTTHFFFSEDAYTILFHISFLQSNLEKRRNFCIYAYSIALNTVSNYSIFNSADYLVRGDSFLYFERVHSLGYIKYSWTQPVYLLSYTVSGHNSSETQLHTVTGTQLIAVIK